MSVEVSAHVTDVEVMQYINRAVFYFVEMSPENVPHISSEAEVVRRGTLDIVQRSSACNISGKKAHVDCVNFAFF